jgi:hypothetical protein
MASVSKEHTERELKAALYRFAMEKSSITANEKRRLYYCVFFQDKNE